MSETGSGSPYGPTKPAGCESRFLLEYLDQATEDTGVEAEAELTVYLLHQRAGPEW